MRKLQGNSDVSKQQLESELKRVQHQKQLYVIFRKITAVILIGFVLVAAMVTWFSVVLIADHAMAPELKSGQWVLAFRAQKLQQGDVVAFKDGEQIFVKRVAACAGDVVEIDQVGNVLINGKKWDSDHSEEAVLNQAGHTYPYLVPAGRVFLINENMSASETMDSWNCGSIEISQVVGKVVFRIWPLKELKYLGLS